MNESCWQDCIENNLSIISTPSPPKIASLKDTAFARIDFFKGCSLTEKSARFILEGYYTSVLEMLHALLVSNGYKVKNHVCLGFFLRDAIKSEELFRKFNDLRKTRNNLVYNGKEIDFFSNKQKIRVAFRLIKKINQMVK
jgi:uncharacterized protein (UPF0332 family)